VETDDAPLLADHPEIPKELALQGFDGVRAYGAGPEASRAALEETLAFAPAGSCAPRARRCCQRRSGVLHLALAVQCENEGAADGDTRHALGIGRPDATHDTPAGPEGLP